MNLMRNRIVMFIFIINLIMLKKKMQINKSKFSKRVKFWLCKFTLEWLQVKQVSGKEFKNPCISHQCTLKLSVNFKLKAFKISFTFLEIGLKISFVRIMVRNNFYSLKEWLKSLRANSWSRNCCLNIVPCYLH